MENVLQDVRYGIRSLLKSRRFALAAVLTLALGIGVNTAMFSVIHSVFAGALAIEGPGTCIGSVAEGFDYFGGKELLWTPLQLRRDSGIGSSPTVHCSGPLFACRME
jgi:hypothetical protein